MIRKPPKKRKILRYGEASCPSIAVDAAGSGAVDARSLRRRGPRRRSEDIPAEQQERYLLRLFMQSPIDDLGKLVSGLDVDGLSPRDIRIVHVFTPTPETAYVTIGIPEHNAVRIGPWIPVSSKGGCPSRAEEDLSCRVAVVWGHYDGRLFQKDTQVVDLHQLASTVWGPRLGKLDFDVLEHQVLGRPANVAPVCSEPKRGALVACAVLVHLLHAAEEPAILTDWEDIAGLGLLAARAGNGELATECCSVVRGAVPRRLERQLERAVECLGAPTALPKNDPKKLREKLRRRRRGLYKLPRVEQLLKLLQRDARPGVIVRKTTKLKWGLNAVMRAGHWETVLKEEHDVSLDVVDELFRLLVVSKGTGEGRHNAYYKNFLHDPAKIEKARQPGSERDPKRPPPPDSLAEKPSWLADAHGKGDNRVHHALTRQHLMTHLFHRGQWRGYVPASDRIAVPNPDYERELKFQGCGEEYLIEELDRPYTQVLIVDLDNHGDEPTDVRTRYEIIIKHLPGAIAYQSSNSGGLHLIYFLPEAVPAYQLYFRVLDLLGDDRDIVKSKGAEIIPTMTGKGNVRLPEGMESVLLDQNLNPFLQDKGIGERLKYLINRAEEQREDLQYLLASAPELERQHRESKTERQGRRKARSRGRGRKERERRPPILRERNYPTTERPARNARPVPQLIFDGEETYKPAATIVGRALWEMWKREIVRTESDLETAQAHLDFWLSDPTNASMSDRLSGSAGVALARRNDLNDMLTDIWPLFIEEHVGACRSTGRGWDAWPDLDEHDRCRVAGLVGEYRRHTGLGIDRSQADTLAKALNKIVSMIVHVRPDRDGIKRVFLLKRDLCRECGLHSAKNVRGRPQPLYYDRVVEFLEAQGILHRISEKGRGRQEFEATWPPPPG